MVDQNKKKSTKAELRLDLVTGNWVVISAKRGKRPHTPFVEAQYKYAGDIATCPFCDPDKSGQKEDVLRYGSTQDWTVRVFPNRYPAFAEGRELRERMRGLYLSLDAIGFHEVVVTRDHYQTFAHFRPEQIAEVFAAYQERYIKLMNKRFVRYISIFHNHGKSAGASISHPHSQLIAIPLVSSELACEINGAEGYFTKNQECVYCDMLAYELQKGERIVYQNSHFVIFCPYASRMGYEMWLLPKSHLPYFERLSREERFQAAVALKEALHRLDVFLNNPDYNFYLHTAPCDGKIYDFYHWHLEILPKYSTWAGFELGTGIEINPILPEKAALELREAK